MHDIITPSIKTELQKAYHWISYDALPKLPASPINKHLRRFVYVVGAVVSAISKMTIIIPIIQCIVKLIFMACERKTSERSRKAQFPDQRLQEEEKKVQALAAKLGLKNPEKIKINLDWNQNYPARTTGSSLLFVSPSFLLTPDDLPEELKLTHLENKTLSEEEWIIKFILWEKGKILSDPLRCQFEVEMLILDTKEILNHLRNRKETELMYEGVLAHELEHIRKKHITKRILAALGWDMLAILTLGISTLFEHIVLAKLERKQEFEADAFGAKRLGTSKGLIKFFKVYLERGKIQHTKYPEFFDHEGNNKSDYAHPPLRERIAKLKAIENKAG